MTNKFHHLHKATTSRLGEVVVSFNTKKPTQGVKQKKKMNIFQRKEQDKSSVKNH